MKFKGRDGENIFPGEALDHFYRPAFNVSPSTMNMLIFETECGEVDPSELTLRSARGREAMSELYEYELELETSREGGLPPEAIDGLLSAPCFFRMSESETVEVHGVLREIRLLPTREESLTHYRVKLVPRLWNLTRQFRTRVYQELAVPQIIETVLGESGIDMEWRLAESYPISEYTVQYEETDFDFISRLLEHWGIYYYFRQGPEGDVMIIADNDQQFERHADYEELTYNISAGRSGVTGSVHQLEALHVPQPAAVLLRDYNWRAPSTQLAEQHDVDGRSGFGLQWRYGEHFKDSGEGQMLARIRAEQMLNRRELFEGICSVPGLAPGHRFQLAGAPIPELEISYLVTSVTPEIGPLGDSGDESYEYHFTAVPIERDDPPSVAYRSQLRTRKPQIVGFMHGIVDGEVVGTAAPIDVVGRYKIILPMDMVAQPGGKASRWIRMAQASSGTHYGIHFPLHVGTEVVISHMDGDPDRPVIMGSVPNTETMSPVVQDNATQSRIKTKSGILVEFDDDVAEP